MDFAKLKENIEKHLKAIEGDLEDVENDKMFEGPHQVFYINKKSRSNLFFGGYGWAAVSDPYESDRDYLRVVPCPIGAKVLTKNEIYTAFMATNSPYREDRAHCTDLLKFLGF